MISKSGYFLEANPKFCEMIGYTGEELKTKTFADITHPDDLKVSFQFYDELQTVRPSVVTGEKRYLHRNGHTVWVKLSMSPVFDEDREILYFVTTIEDISQRRHSESLFRNQVSALEMMANQAPLKDTLHRILELIETHAVGSASCICLLQDQKLNAYVSPKLPFDFIRMIQDCQVGPTGGSCGAAAFFGKRFFSNDIEKDPCWTDEHRKYLLGLGFRSAWSIPVFSKWKTVIGALSIFWKESKSPASNDHQLFDVATYLAGIAIERNQTEKLLKEQQMKLISNSKLVALGEMAGGLAHEINNPLMIVNVQASKLLAAAENSKLTVEMAASIAHQITNTTKRISKIISGLRTFARDGEQESRKEVLIESILEETLSFCRERFRYANIDLRMKLDPSLKLYCRSIQLSQVILNLLNNAYDAVLTEAEKWVEISVLQKSGSIEIAISDSGSGIPVDLREKIFQPFFTTKDVNKGTGLGLSISSSIIESHSGKLYLDEKSEHTRFVITLPLES